MDKILNWILLQRTLLKNGILLFSAKDLVRIFHVSSAAAALFLHRYTKKGLIVHLKKSPIGGLYALADNPPNLFWVANKLYEPSYISFDSALSFHRVIPETIYTITSATTKATREFKTLNNSFQYSRIKKDFFTGYKPTEYQNGIILMAEPEKALADYLYFVDLSKRSLEYERINMAVIDREKLLAYLKQFNRRLMLLLCNKLYANPRKH